MLKIYKIGGGIIDNQVELSDFLHLFSQEKSPKILVHGGGKGASKLLQQLGIEPKMVDGRRITDQETLDVVTGLYAGNINKSIVAQLQKFNINALGLSGADANCITATKRPVHTIDYGFVGDLDEKSVDAARLQSFIESNLTPVLCAITHDKKGNLYNTNADTIASQVAIALSKFYQVELNFCFDKVGVLRDINDDSSLISSINNKEYQQLKADKIIFEGMIPKLDNAFEVIAAGVKQVNLVHALNIHTETKTVLC